MIDLSQFEQAQTLRVAGLTISLTGVVAGVAIFIVAAVITPPDVVSQLVLAIPLLILFEVSLLLMRPASKIAEEKAAAEVEQAAAASGEGQP